MGGERRTTTPQPPAPETDTVEEPAKEKQGGINTIQIAAATGASTTAAVVANLLGVYGTIIGVAVISVVSSVATVLYLKSINGTKNRLRRVVRAANQSMSAKTEATTALRADSPGRTATVTFPVPDAESTVILPTVTDSPATGRAQVPTEVVTAPISEAASTVLPAREEPEAAVPWWNRYGKTMALSSLVVFVLSIAVLSGIALLSGQDANTFYQDSSPSGSGNQPEQQEQEADTGVTQPADDQSPTPSEEPSTTPDKTPGEKPSQEPSTPPTDPEETTSDTPTSPLETPSQTVDPDEGGGDEAA